MFTNLTATQLENDPRYILKKVLKEAEDMGYEFNVGPECEFFPFHTDELRKPNNNQAMRKAAISIWDQQT